jgi:hypothetical protein
MPLKRFTSGEIYISGHEAWTILRFFFGAKLKLREDDLTEDDINFSQGLLLQAIDSSYAIGHVQILHEAFYSKVPGSVTDMEAIKKNFIQHAAKHWFTHLGTKDLSQAMIYEVVRNQLAANFNAVLAERRATGEYFNAW